MPPGHGNDVIDPRLGLTAVACELQASPTMPAMTAITDLGATLEEVARLGARLLLHCRVWPGWPTPIPVVVG